MGIYLRTETDSHGDAVGYRWYCSQSCYTDSFLGGPIDGLEDGGAYPCGAEHDSPDFCAICEAPVGNPLTDEGYSLIREWLQDLPFRLDPTGSLTRRAADLRRMYFEVESV